MDDRNAPWLLSRETMSPAERWLLGIAAALPLWAVWDLVIRPWPALLSLIGLLILPIALGALPIGGLFLAAAILAPEREVRIDALGRRVLDQGATRWFGPWWRSYPFEDIEDIAVDKDPDTEGADRWRLQLRLRGRKAPVVLATRPAPAALEPLAARLRAALQP